MSENQNLNTPQTHIFPLGYRCSSAGILKQLSLKTESYPFDWLVSRLPVIQHCLETNFRYFIQDISNNYAQYKTVTQHYEFNGTTTFICDETVVANTYYNQMPISLVHFAQPLRLPHDTYAFPLVMNHHNIFTPSDFEYYQRCIQRFHNVLNQPTQPTMYLYIHPALSTIEFEMHKSSLISEIKSFQQFLQTTYPQTYPKGIVFIPIKTQHPYPITNVYPNPIETIHNTLNTNNEAQCIINVVYMNKDFIDAGEIFMRNAYIETDAISAYVKQMAYNTRP